MKVILQRLRGALGTGLTWAAGWGVLGAVHGLILGIFKPWQWEFYNPIVDEKEQQRVSIFRMMRIEQGNVPWLEIQVGVGP